MRIVHPVTPLRAGLFQFHCNLLPGLAKRGCEMIWLSSGAAHAREISEFNGTRTEGEVVAAHTNDPTERTEALVHKIEAISPDILIWPALGDPIELNALRYVPEGIPRVLVLHSSSLATYRGARTVRDYVNRTVAISPRIKQDLIRSYGFQPDQLQFIPHGIDTSPYLTHPLRESAGGRVRILSHGRIIKEKGVYWIPEILAQLARNSKDWECTISGDGPDFVGLQQQFERAGLLDRVRFTGWTASEFVPRLIGQHDIFLFPTQSEGYPIALIEAMAGGCAPVASRLPGISDWLITEGANGMQFPVGDTRRAALQILELIADRNKLNALRRRAQESVRNYSLEWMTEQYYQLLSDTQRRPGRLRPAERLANCKLASGLRPAWWYRLPDPIKDRLRIARERIRASVSIT